MTLDESQMFFLVSDTIEETPHQLVTYNTIFVCPSSMSFGQVILAYVLAILGPEGPVKW